APPAPPRGEALAGKTARRPEADDARNVEGARAQAPLLSAALRLRLQADSRAGATDIKGADTLRAKHLVGRPAAQVDLPVVDVDWNAAHGLDRIAVEGNAARPAVGADLRHRLQRAHLVVRRPHRHQSRVWAGGGGHRA